MELCQSDHWVLGSLPDQGPSPSIAQFGHAARKSLGGSKLIPFKNDGGHCFLGERGQFPFPMPHVIPSLNISALHDL